MVFFFFAEVVLYKMEHSVFLIILLYQIQKSLKLCINYIAYVPQVSLFDFLLFRITYFEINSLESILAECI